QLARCELRYEMYLDHFRGKGVRLTEPPVKLMVALFDRQEGFEAYVGEGVPAQVTGVFHLPSNRLVVYDYGRNRALLKSKEQAEQFARTLRSDPDRDFVLGWVRRQAND